ncbi:kinase-like domain-containing protein [Globomyces pollinis-pini]|nr:kinase-like domain-containing protein [Globomyces pollinis-pini]
MVLVGAMNMLKADGNQNRKLIENKIEETRHRINFLECELSKLKIQNPSIVNDSEALDDLPFALLQYGNLTKSKVDFKVNYILDKLAVEDGLKSGNEHVMQQHSGSPLPKEYLLKAAQLSDYKLTLLKRAKTRYTQLHVKSRDSTVTLPNANERRTGRLKMQICGTANITDRTSDMEKIMAHVFVDGLNRISTKPSKTKWDCTMDIEIVGGLEVEIHVTTETGLIVALVWFKIKDLEDYLDAKFGTNRSSTFNVGDIWLDLEPSGQILLRPNFFVPQLHRDGTDTNQLRRAQAVHKVYPRNGHEYVPRQQPFAIMKCSVCNEFLGLPQSYQCTGCNNLIHPHCYHRVITQCLASEEMKDAVDKNTGQLLKFRIPHRWDTATNILPNWCGHCGMLFSPGSKIQKCTECGKCSHTQCFEMIPHFCGLSPSMADTLVLAFEEHQQKLLLKELEESETIQQNDTPYFQTDSASSASLASISEAELKKDIEDASGNTEVNSVISDTKLSVRSSFKSAFAKMVRPKSVNVIKQLYVDPKKVSIDDFNMVAVLGRGAYGKVMLATEKKTNTPYALKALKKDAVIAGGEIKSVMVEKRILQTIGAESHPFFVNLHFAFDTPSRIYLVMEYISGGDLMGHLAKLKRFPPKRAHFYACEVLMALQHFHKNKIIYRDLKLENILLCADGHIKVADYGVCKDDFQYGQSTSTFCGTLDYMAPEILAKQKYGLAVDWWAFGVLIYVMIIGRYPFHSKGGARGTLQTILNGALEFPPNIPSLVKHIISSLLTVNYRRRLGSGKDGAEEVKRHRFFQDVDWKRLLRKEFPPPYVPVVSGGLDFSNFEEEFTNQSLALTPTAPFLETLAKDPFTDFGFISNTALQERIAVALSN